MASYGFAIGRTRAQPMGVRDMLQKPAVFITAIICGTFLGLGVLVVMGWLLYQQRDAQTLFNLVQLCLTAFLYKRLNDVDTRAARVEQHVNGNHDKLLSAVIQSSPVQVDSESK